jgi:hypothetical protein
MVGGSDASAQCKDLVKLTDARHVWQEARWRLTQNAEVARDVPSA